MAPKNKDKLKNQISIENLGLKDEILANIEDDKTNKNQEIKMESNPRAVNVGAVSLQENEDVVKPVKVTKRPKKENIENTEEHTKEKTNKNHKLTKLGNKKNKTEENKPVRVRRIKTDYKSGLTLEQVADRNEKGLNNFTPNTNVKTYKSIFFENIFTFFNLLCFAIFASLAIVGAWKSCIFMFIIVANIAIGIIQEIRAKRTIEKLSLLIFVTPSTKLATFLLNKEAMSSFVVLVSSKVSCSKPAHIVSLSACISAKIRATFNG